jgi:hypothetical protein
MMIKDRKDWFMFFRQYYINMHVVSTLVRSAPSIPKDILEEYKAKFLVKPYFIHCINCPEVIHEHVVIG